MSKIHLRISHSLLVAIATAGVQAMYTYATGAGVELDIRILVTSLLTGAFTGLLGYTLSALHESGKTSP